MNNNPLVRYVYFFDKLNPHGGVTIGYKPVLHDSKNYPQGIFAEVAIAYCNPKDQFSRPMGRQLVTDMLDEGQSLLMPIYSLGAPVGFFRNMFSISTI